MSLVNLKEILSVRASPRLFAAYDILSITTDTAFSRKQAFDMSMQDTRCVDRALKLLIEKGLLEMTVNPRKYIKTNIIISDYKWIHIK